MDDGEPLTDNEEALNINDLSAEDNFHLTTITKGKVSIKKPVREALDLNASEETPIVIFEDPHNEGVFGGKILDDSEVIELINGE